MIKTADDFARFVAALLPGDKLGLHADDFTADAIQWGTDVNDPITMCHFFNYAGGGQTIEADGKHVCGQHLINDYLTRVTTGHARLLVFRVSPPLTIGELQNERDFWAVEKNENYNAWENFWFGAWGVVDKLTPALGSWLSTHLTNPAYNSKSVVCSQEVILCDKNNPRIYNPIVTDKKIEDMTPDELVLRITRTCPLVIDTDTFF
jgi:hypothetical protein